MHIAHNVRFIIYYNIPSLRVVHEISIHVLGVVVIIIIMY